MNKYKFKKGDNVYVHSSDKRDKDFESVILSAGNRWITIENFKMRFYADSLWSEYGGYSLYPSKEIYESEVKRHEKYLVLVKKMQSFDVYDNISIEALEKINEILKKETNG